MPELEFDSTTTKMSLVTVPTMETVAISFWLDNLLPNKHGAMLIGAAGCGKTALINGKLRTLPEDYSSRTININYYTNANMYQKIIEAPLEKKAGKNFGPPGNKKLIYFVDDLNMAALDNYNTASNISLMRQHMGYGHIYDLNKLSQKVLLNTQYLAAMNPTAGSFIVNPRLQRLFATFAINFPSLEALNTIYATFLLGHLSKFSEEVQECGKRVVQAALQLHKRVARTFRKTASNFHYEFNVRHVAGVFQGMLMGQARAVPGAAQDDAAVAPRVGARLRRPPRLRLRPQEVQGARPRAGEEVLQGDVAADALRRAAHLLPLCAGRRRQDLRPHRQLRRPLGLLNGALDEYNETNAAMNLVLFEDAMRHVCRISRIIESSGGHALMVGVGGMGKQSLARLATFVNGYSTFQVVITARYGVNDLKADLQIMYRKAGLKGEGISFIFTDQQIADERFLVFMNDLLSSGNIPGLFPAEDMDDIINNMRPPVKRAGLPDTRDNCWDMFINAVRDNLHVILCFSPIGDPIKIRTRRFPALVNCVVIDWFQPWPEEALTSVSKRFLGDVDLGDDDEAKENIMNFMPYSFLAGEQVLGAVRGAGAPLQLHDAQVVPRADRAVQGMLAKRARRRSTKNIIKKLSDGVIKLEKTAERRRPRGGDQGQGGRGRGEEGRGRRDDPQARGGEGQGGRGGGQGQRHRRGRDQEGGGGHRDEGRHRDQARRRRAGARRRRGRARLAQRQGPGRAQVAQEAAGGRRRRDGRVHLPAADQGHAVQEGRHLVEGRAGDDDAAAQVPRDHAWLQAEDRRRPRAQVVLPQHPGPAQGAPHFNVEIQRKKSNAAAGLTDFIININIYNDINENVEPMRLAAQNATDELNTAIASKDGGARGEEARGGHGRRADAPVQRGERREGGGHRRGGAL